MSQIVPVKATRVALIEAAERLIAEQGTGHVSHREIAAAAGQRNLSVITYHFGGLDGLIVGILEHRMAAVAVRRRELWKKVPEEGSFERMSALAEAFIVPLHEFVEEAQGESYYARFLEQLDVDPRPTPWEFTEGVLSGASLAKYQRFAGSIKDVAEPLRAELNNRMYPKITELRIRVAFKVVIHSLAERERVLAGIAQGDSGDILSCTVFRNALVDIYLNILLGSDSTALAE